MLSAVQEALSQICEYSEAGITVRGTYYPPNKEPKEGDRKLYLGIEATNELAIQKAKTEIIRLIKEELQRLVSDRSGGGGSYRSSSSSSSHTTLWAIKTCHIILDRNSHVSWCIFTPVVRMETGMNTLRRSYKIYNFTLTASPHYMIN